MNPFKPIPILALLVAALPAFAQISPTHITLIVTQTPAIPGLTVPQ